MMPNQQRGHIVESRADYAQQQLDQYTKTKEQIFSIDQERKEELSWKQALSSPTIERAGSEAAEPNVGKDTTKKDFSYLSAEQQERYAQLRMGMANTQTSRDQEMEM